MGLEAKLVQRLSQQLLMTPQLQQAIKLLQLGRLEYIEAIEKELLENPVLEIAQDDDGSGTESRPTDVVADSMAVPESALLNGDSAAAQPESIPESTKESPVDMADYLESLSDHSGMSSPKGLVDHEDRPSVENTLTRTENLAEHLLLQLRMMDLTQADEKIALQIVGNLNKDGYLCSTYQELAEACQQSVSHVEDVARKVRSLDPPGVAARNLGECLFIQLEQQGLGDSLAARIVVHHLDKLEKRAYDKIAKIEEVAVEDVYKAVQAIQTLEPRPGRPYGDDSVRYIIPDIYVYKVGEEYVITLNDDGMPKLRVSPYYLEILSKADNAETNPHKAYLNERLKAATWLIKSIHQRQKTIYRVTESIVKFQKEFFDHGISRLRPMVLKDVADDIGMHESTVSRVTTNKYVHTSHGVFELKFFFTSGLKAGNSDISSSTVKEKIKALIAVESTDKPISDQEIVEILKQEGIEIARRTVAKYRESLGILSSSKRKRVF